MATLIIPDVHERMDRLAAALRDRLAKADRVVFLGDWFDAFGPLQLDRVEMACKFINGNIDGLLLEDHARFVDHETTDGGGRVIPATFLLGNHDCHYFFDHPNFMCSGYTPAKKEVIEETMSGDAVEQFRIFTRVGPYLVSHAGFTEATMRFATEEVEAEALQAAYDGKFDPIFGAGYARGGRQPIGGPTWLDWNAEFQHIPSQPQIVGHTNGSAVRTKGEGSEFRSWCIDTALHFVAWVDEDTGVVTAEAVKTAG